jgi:predicted Zn-dependent peptidase
MNQDHQMTTLDNGLRLVTASMPHTRSVSAGFFIGTGSRYETEKHAGISHFLEHLCFKGTTNRRTASEICAAIEGVGGILNGGTDKELTVYWCKVAQMHFPIALEVLVDMLLNSVFDPAEIEKERQVIMEEINMSLDSPPQRVGMLIDSILWPEHPLGRDIAGTKESVAAISKEMMLDYMAGHYRANNTVLAIAGNVRHEDVVKIAEKATRSWKNQGTPQTYQSCQDDVARRVLIENRETEQTQLCMALPGLSITHPDRLQIDLLNVILGEGMSSRLFTEIRDKLGLAYSIQSYADHFLDTGAVVISAGVDNKHLKVAIKAILEELARLKDLTPETELTKAKELYKGRLLLRMEDSRSVAGWLGGQEVLTGKILSVDDVVTAIDAITSAELRRVADGLLTGEKLRLAVVGPVSPDEPLEDLLKL